MSDLGMMGAPTGLGAPPQPMMVPNPAFAQWAQQAQAWIAEKQQKQQKFLQACELIKGDARNRFKIDIEADSTIAADEQAEKAARTDFLKEITPFLEVVIPGLMANPALAPLAKELGLFAVRAFPVARPLEDAFEAAFDQLAKQAATHPQPPAGAQGKNTKSPMEVQAEAQESAGKQQTDQQANMIKLIAIQQEGEIERERLEATQQKDATEIALRGRELVGREALANARVSHMASRDTAGLI